MTTAQDSTYKQIRGEIAVGEDLDYSITYAKTFAKVSPTDSVAAAEDSTWTVSGNVTQGTDTITGGGIATLWITPDGTARVGNIIRMTNTVLTAGGRKHVRLIILKVVNRLAAVPATVPAE